MGANEEQSVAGQRRINPQNGADNKPGTDQNHNAYWKQNLRILAGLLTVWFVVSFGCGILWVDVLNEVRIGGFKLGFWFAQQGSIVAFVLIIIAYVKLMNRLDRLHDVDDRRRD